MGDFFLEGGWGMWPILVFGMMTLGAAGRFAGKPELRQLAFIGAMAATTVGSIFNATWTDCAAVFQHLAEKSPIPDEQFRTMLLEGLKESTRPGTLGGILLTLSCLLLSVGALRASKREA